MLDSQKTLQECSGESEKDKVLSTTIEELDFAWRIYNCLKRAGINTVQDLTERTIEDILGIKNLGRHHLQAIVDKLHSLGLDLKLNN